MENLNDVLNNFQINGDVLSIEKYGNGHINRTYLVTTTAKRYILQQINSHVFPNVAKLMDNIYYVTQSLADKGVESLEIIKTKDGSLFYKDNNLYFRVYKFVENSLTIESVTDDETLYKDAFGFGAFHRMIKDLDASKLFEVIPDFHNTVKRYSNFCESLSNDIKKRANSCQNEIKWAQKFSNDISRIYDGLKDGSIPLSITHNDTKINNILFDKDTKAIRCVIDLDTIMPGTYLYDFGDALRSLFSGENEDSKDYEKVIYDPHIFEVYAKGYLKIMKDALTPKEIELLPYSAFLLTYECGIRFLADYLDGDVYFHTKYDEHNLVRARTQLNLAESIYNNLDSMNQIIKEILN